MANQYFSFYYDPARQGYSTTTWATLSGVPAIVGGKLSLLNASAIHCADILRGDIVFDVTFHAPTAGDDSKFGLYQLSRPSYLYFKIAGNVLTVEASNAGVTSSTVVAWDSTWTNTGTDFRIKWESGSAKFYIGGQYKATLEGASIPTDPMSIYTLSNTTTLLVNYVDAKDIQSLLIATLS